MKKLMNLGEVLNKNEQKAISGGSFPDLSKVCGYIKFTSVESQCLALADFYKPLWIASEGKCSATGQCQGGGGSPFNPCGTLDFALGGCQ